MRSIYGFNLINNQGAGQTIALVDAFDNPDIESDFAVFTSTFGLPACTTSNGCFKKIYASGSKPRTNLGWAGEIALDVEWAYAIAPQAKIILVEAASASNTDLLSAIDVAVQNGATVVSMSWGGAESSTSANYDTHFNKPGIAFVASSGDGGHAVQFPAVSKYVVGVGGTSLTYTSQGAYVSEIVWNNQYGATGGGVSAYQPKPSYQSSAQTTSFRGVPDVAYDADPATGVPVYNTTALPRQQGWGQYGGTSASAPQIAALIAIVNSQRSSLGKGALSYPAAFYQATANFHDIVSGTNGTCGSVCTAAVGYDFTTGIGTPISNNLISALVALP